MINKELLKKRFQKSLKTYNDNAVVQKILAKKLVDLLPEKKFASILEIGCGSGILTKIINSKYKPKKYFLNDIVQDCENFIDEILSEKTFICGDIDEICINETFDLIISNAALQWSENLKNTLEKLSNMLNKGGILAFSIFAKDNFPEIKDVLNTSLDYQDPQIFSELKVFYLNPEVLWFDNPKDVLKHLKLTGVNALKQEIWSKSKLKNFENIYKSKFEKNGKVSLTYKPICAIFEKLY